ncbi:uncharacterized protein LOC135209931 [Macrobrachium nipponense]|uniref:uncharacterized protein LOC135209931 n=1 Tax=Macrobrachium nipponense TaxID=159736 RepID=UPI0030C83461
MKRQSKLSGAANKRKKEEEEKLAQSRGIHRRFLVLFSFVVGTTLIYLLYNGVPIPGPINSSNTTLYLDDLIGLSHLINTPSCVIPDIDPFHPSLRKFMAKDPKPNFDQIIVLSVLS